MSLFCHGEDLPRLKVEMSQAEAQQFLKKSGVKKKGHWQLFGEKLENAEGVLSWMVAVIETPEIKDGSYCWMRATRILEDSELCKIDNCSRSSKGMRHVDLRYASNVRPTSTCEELVYPRDFARIKDSIDTLDLDRIYAFISGENNMSSCRKNKRDL